MTNDTDSIIYNNNKIRNLTKKAGKNVIKKFNNIAT